MKIKQKPEDFVVREGYRFESDPEGSVWVYRMDKQKISTLQALERISKEFAVRRRYMKQAPLAFGIYCLRYMKRMRSLRAEAAH